MCPWRWCLLLVLGCNSGFEAGGLGVVAFTDDGGTRLRLVDVENGSLRTLDVAPSLGGLSVSVDGAKVAYGTAGDSFSAPRNVTYVGIDGAAPTAIDPATNDYGINLEWGRGGWFRYTSGNAFGARTVLVPADAAESRLVGTVDVVQLAESPDV